MGSVSNCGSPWAFADALLALDELGHADVVDRLVRRWRDVPLPDLHEILVRAGIRDPDPPPAWVGRLVDARFDAETTTEWERLVDAGIDPDEAISRLIASREP